MSRIVILAVICGGAQTIAGQAFLRKDLPAGDRPSRVLIGDFNGDSRPDLAVNSAAGLSIFMNMGGGAFARPVTTPGAIHPMFGPEPSHYTLAADFNLDGRLDLAGVVEPHVGRLLLGRGDGTFTNLDIGPANTIAGTGDFNGDRIPDLVVLHDDLSWGIHLGDGTGAFRRTARIENASFAPAIADFDKDGFADVAASLPTGAVRVWLSRGDGSFRPPVETPEAAAGVVADFNRDGLPDMASRSEVLLGKGDGTFRAVRYVPSRRGFSTPFAAADFDGDGHVDLAGWLYDEGSGNAIVVFRGRGDGTLALPVEPFADWAVAGEAAADLDGDSRPELVTANFRSNTVTLLFPRPQSGPAMNRAVSAASGRAIVAPESLATIFVSTGVSSNTAATPPYPSRLGGIAVEVRDSAGVTRPARLLFVSATQINFEAPAGTAPGEAAVIVTGDRGPVLAGGMQVEAVAPAIFLVSEPNSTPAATATRVAADGRQSPVPVFNCFGPPGGSFSCGPAPIRVGADAVYLSFYATGFRGATTSNVTATLNGVKLPVEYAGPQGTPGVDQINIRILPEAVLQGPAFVTLAIDGVPANPALLQMSR